MTQMADIPAGSVWVMWTLASVLLTLLVMLQPAAAAQSAVQAAAPQESVQDARRQLVTQPGMMDERPDLKEKILKLHQSLERI